MVDGPLVDDPSGRVGERPVHDVRVAGHPPDVGHAPVDVGLRMDVEDEPMGGGHPGQVAAGGVHDALGLGGGPRRIQQVEQVLRVHRLRRGGRGLPGNDVVVPVVAALVPGHLRTSPPHHDAVLDR